MDTQVKRLFDERERMYHEARALVETVLSENRNLTPEEDLRVSQLTAEVDKRDDRIKELQDAEERKAQDDRARRASGLESAARGGDRQPETEYRAGRWLAAELRALTGAGVTGGGAYTPAEAAKYFFDILEAKSVALRSGIRQVRTERDSVIVPRLLTDVGAAWIAEAGTITQTSLTADQLTATPRKLAGIERMSNELTADSDPAILDIVGMSLVRSISLKFDLGVYEGSGTPPEIRGLKNVSGISTVSMGTNGTAFANLDPFADALGQLETDNATGNAIVMHPRSWQALTKLKEQTSGNNKPLLQESAGAGSQGIQRSIYGVPVFLSSQLSITETQGSATDASSAYVYDASAVVAVMRQDVRVERDSSRLFNSDESEVRAIMRADVVVPTPKAVVRVLGIIP